MVDINIENAVGVPEGAEFEVEDEGALGAAWPEAEVLNDTGDETPLFQLKARRDNIAKDLTRPFRVPRWEDPEIYCDFTLIEPSILAKALNKREKQKNRPDDWVAWAYADVLAPAVKAVYAVLNNDTEVKYSLRENDANGSLTRIDTDLAVALGLDPISTNASATFRKLFFSEGDLIELANRVFKWSSIVNEEADETF
jgi:hypothetical protein